jgi:transcriptional activator of cad operon
MERPLTTKALCIGDWHVSPASGQISRDGGSLRLEVRTMRLLLCLAERAGEIVSIDEVLDQVWGEVTVSPDSVYQAVASLRRQLGDDPKQPTYIETVPRLGYRMVAKVSIPPDSPTVPAETRSDFAPASEGTLPVTADSDRALKKKNRARLRPGFALAAGAALCFVLILVFAIYGKISNRKHSVAAESIITVQPQESVAVLPFLDLTKGMTEEEFADGMTEELIDKLSKIPGLRVPAPTSSFYYKNKQIPITDIAKSLGVSYVLDGSVRKSGARVRIAARLVRVDSAYVLWSETYDRRFDDTLTVQDDIAGEVTKALKLSIGSRMGDN